MTSQSSSDQWYYAQGNCKVGPVTLARLCELLADGRVTATDMVLQEGTPKWRPPAEVAGSAAGRAPVRKRWPRALAGGAALALLVSCLGGGLAVWRSGRAETKKDVSPVPRAVVPGKVEPAGPANEKRDHETVSRGNQEPPAKEAKESEPPREPEPAPDSPKQRPSLLGMRDASPRGDAGPTREPDSKRLTLVYQLGHTGMVSAVAFSPDGKQVLTGSADKTARLWDVASGRELRVFKGTSGFMMSVAFSPDGKQVLIGEHAGDWRLWDAASGKILEPYGKPPLAFSPDGKLLFTGGWPSARLWDTASGKAIWKLDHKDFRVVGLPQEGWAAVAFSPDGKQILLGGAGMAQLWDTANAKEIRRFHVDKGTIKSVAFSPDGKQVLAASTVGPTVRLWDVASGVEIRAFQADGGEGSSSFPRTASGCSRASGCGTRPAARKSAFCREPLWPFRRTASKCSRILAARLGCGMQIPVW